MQENHGAYILFHGRHILHTRFQEELLARLVSEHEGPPKVIFAITSANHANSRYNPVPFHYRVAGIDRFAQKVLAPRNVSWEIAPVPHMPPTDRFVSRIVAYANAACGERIAPGNALVVCSTPPLIEQFSREGYAVETAEYDLTKQEYVAPTPQQILSTYGEHLTGWEAETELTEVLSSATQGLWRTYPDIPQEIERLWNETLLTEAGDITESRDYGTYTFSMSRMEVIDRKYEDIKDGIVPGVIVDEGCADGALLVRVAQDFPDSDLIGIEITREYIAQAQERQRRGDFGNAFVFFHQRNLGKPVFPDTSVDTTICNSTTHEIWSYAGEDDALRAYLGHKYAQLRPGGTLLIRDVIGPEEGEELVYARFSETDGETPAPEDCADRPAASLSTLGRFYRFAREFYNGRGVVYEEVVIDGLAYIRLSRKDAADFMSKKEYTDNWDSELHEDFTHWSYSRWKQELERIGFALDETKSGTYTSPWIVEHHFAGTVELYRLEDGALVPEPYPPTNVVIVARK